jgi:hypothetical protein
MQVCGEGEGVIGDGIVPVHSGLLDGAHHVVLDGIFHSMSQLGTFEEPSSTLLARTCIAAPYCALSCARKHASILCIKQPHILVHALEGHAVAVQVS